MGRLSAPCRKPITRSHFLHSKIGCGKSIISDHIKVCVELIIAEFISSAFGISKIAKFKLDESFFTQDRRIHVTYSRDDPPTHLPAAESEAEQTPPYL